MRLSAHAVTFSPAQERQVAELLAVLQEAGVSPPDRTELEAELGISSELVDALLAQGRLVEVAAGLVYERSTLDGLVGRFARTSRPTARAPWPRSATCWTPRASSRWRW